MQVKIQPRGMIYEDELFFSAGGSDYGSDFDIFEWVAEFAPGVEAALQGADTFDALFSEEQRHTGAGGFVWSSTVENDFAVAR
jgi:hypothetical protein